MQLIRFSADCPVDTGESMFYTTCIFIFIATFVNSCCRCWLKTAENRTLGSRMKVGRVCMSQRNYGLRGSSECILLSFRRECRNFYARVICMV